MGIFRRWLVLLRIPIVLVGVGVFFACYNRYLLDTNLQNLKTSLSILDAATGVGQAEAALLLVDQTLITQMAQEELDLKKLATLQYVHGTLASGGRMRPVADTQTMVATLAEDRAVSRPGFLKTLDGVATGVRETFRRAQLLPRQLLGGKTSRRIDQDLLQEAMRSERLGLFAKSAQIYETLLEKFPDYIDRATLKFRLGSLYRRLQDWRRAERLFQEALRETRDPKQLEVARQMLSYLGTMRGKADEAKTLQDRLETLGSGRQRQRAAYELGALQIELYDFNEAAKAFREAYLADPDGKFALPALFKEGWCLRSVGRFDDAFDRFKKIIDLEPQSGWAASAYHQMAEAYKSTGDYKAATKAYEKILGETQDYAFVAMVHAQAGSTFRFDLNDPEQAQIHFRELAKSFPASQFVGVERSVDRLLRAKGIPVGSVGPGAALEAVPAAAPQPKPSLMQLGMQQLAEGTPLMNWLENFVPVFVEVFTNRLARYMQIAGVKELTRRFSEDEFNKLVVRRVRERFPGQVKNVKMQIREDGYVGTGTVKLGILTFPVKARIGIEVIEERAHVIIQEIRVGKLSVPEPLRKILETRVNLAVVKAKYPLRIKEYQLEDGYAFISVEMD